MPNRKIDPADRAKAIALLLEVKAGTRDITATEIADLTGLSKSTVSAEAKGAGVKLRGPGRPTVIDHQRVIELYESQFRVADIVRELGHPNRAAIDKIIKKYLDEKCRK